MKTKNNYHDRKPDVETESFRMWKLKGKEMETAKEIKEENDIKIKVGDTELNICGFTIVRNKDNKIVFAYKFKHEEKMIMYYTSQEDKSKTDMMIAIFKLNPIDYQVIDMRSIIKNLKNEKHLWEDNKSEDSHRSS